jgi:hypothetical protein
LTVLLSELIWIWVPVVLLAILIKFKTKSVN